MIFVVEDGAARRNANSFAGLSFARSFASSRHLEGLLDATDEALKALLVRGADYIEQRWGQDFIGQRKTSLQGLSWPRDYAYDELGEVIDTVPLGIQIANVELASRAKVLGALLPDPPSPYPVADADGVTAGVTSGQIVSTRQRVGDIETSTTYSGSVGGSSQPITSKVVGGVSVPSYPAVDMLMRPFLIGGGRGQVAIRY